MEFPLRLTRLERALALALLAPVLWAAWLEARSPVATAAREGKPWACWLTLEARSSALPRVLLAYYRPNARTLDLIYVPENLRLDGNKTLPQLAAAARRSGATSEDGLAATLTDAAEAALTPDAPQGLRDALAPRLRHFDRLAPEQEEPPLAAKDWLRAQLTGARALRRAWRLRRGAPAGELAGFEQLRLGLELARLPDDQLRAVYLPDDPSDRAAYFARLEEQPAPAPAAAAAGAASAQDDRPVTVEVLNATAKSGIANTAKKILRSKGADVVSTGNGPARERTLVVDRVGRPELAARVRRMLSCPSAQALTQVDAKRLVDVSVVIADDCALRE